MWFFKTSVQIVVFFMFLPIFIFIHVFLCKLTWIVLFERCAQIQVFNWLWILISNWDLLEKFLSRILIFVGLRLDVSLLLLDELYQMAVLILVRILAMWELQSAAFARCICNWCCDQVLLQRISRDLCCEFLHLLISTLLDQNPMLMKVLRPSITHHIFVILLFDEHWILQRQIYMCRTDSLLSLYLVILLQIHSYWRHLLLLLLLLQCLIQLNVAHLYRWNIMSCLLDIIRLQVHVFELHLFQFINLLC